MQMIAQIYPYSREISASMHVNANERKYSQMKSFFLNVADIQKKYFRVYLRLFALFAFSFSL